MRGARGYPVGGRAHRRASSRAAPTGGIERCTASATSRAMRSTRASGARGARRASAATSRRELALDGRGQRVALAPGELEPVHDQLVDADVHPHGATASTRKSASSTGSSSLRNSTRAISSTRSIVTLLPRPAAQ